ncbi:MAG: tRNA (N(6)-L-threonylcarbamoyladenosine(37)-C(2))-methylthiotransferase MtaB [candidate division Zixibacteria bacterium]
MPKVALAYTGCKLNRYEIQVISESLEGGGFEIVPFKEKADCYLINTCSVTNGADVSSRQLIRRARRTAPDSKVVVTGCYAQLRPDEIEKIGADLVVSNLDKERIPARIIDLFDGTQPLTDNPSDREFGSRAISNMGNLTRAFVKIQEGCNRGCTYCTIWISRGPVRSRSPEFVIREVNNLHENGYKEIVLTGVHIGKYSYDDMDLTGLLRRILKETAMPRIRLSSLYPSEIDDDLVDLISSNPRICPHAHLSIQSGDDTILKSMGRTYERNELIDIIEKLKSAVPGITIGADIMVGFPGETDKYFQNSYDLVEQTGIHHLHVFPFSPRPGTKAVNMIGAIPSREKEGRARILRRLGQEMKNTHLRSFMGQELNVLFEKRKSCPGHRLTGLTENYLRVRSEGSESLKGEIIAVKPFKVEGETLLANINASPTLSKRG